jgi:ribonuclease BN (tRNA processing enzyme)
MRSSAILVGLLAVSAGCSPGQPSEARVDRSPETTSSKPGVRAAARTPLDAGAHLVVLGSGTPVPDPARSGPAAAVVVGSTAYLVDFGPGVVRRAEAASRNGIEALDARRLAIAFATHLHSDHTAGLADLVLTPAVVGRHEPLRLFGPPGIEAMARDLLAAYAADLDARRATGDDMRGYEVRTKTIAPPREGLIEAYRDERTVVRAFAVSHGETEALGYRFDAGGRSFVVSGDTAPSAAVAEACAGCDVLLHEVYCEKGFRAGPPGWQEYHRTHHTSGVELGALAARAMPKRLVATHVLDFGCTDAQILSEIASSFQGPAAIARDGEVF